MNREELFKLENAMWEAAKNRDAAAYLDIVSGEAVMVCGGYRCSGQEYAQIVGQFDCKSYRIDDFEIVGEDENTVQSHYIVTVEVSDPRNADLAGVFHVTTTWKRINDRWKAIFNMDQRLE